MCGPVEKLLVKLKYTPGETGDAMECMDRLLTGVCAQLQVRT